ncbi:type I restriction enzyme R subunit/putative DNA methylase [Prosthecobacter fusiformis]|uniref:Type I restriction enzyme R subunit/putative DNA methylase n=1 Tax=Prosthecobacter fusiformis TaxID=48464 RepID=A0A4R7RKV3_9BACT|nr:transposase [Prosthecobacter fusiformis]TDU64275.1 type I restriction enzyme R subunit/putative DNA methylase [Prosthecobacter fusiformis]
MAISKDHSGWTDRGFLPHYDHAELVQSVTFRLADSLPKEKLLEWEHLLKSLDDRERIRQIELYLDRGSGSCVLRRQECAEIVEKALLHFEGQRYQLIAWCIMPNHVHVLMKTFMGHPLGRVVHSWKTFTAREINRLLGQSGPFWQEDYYDTFMRDEEHQYNEVLYIESNPVKAGLVGKAVDWPWSSAARKWRWMT